MKTFCFHSYGASARLGPMAFSFGASRSHSVGLLWTSDLARRRDLYLTTHNTHEIQTSLSPAGFEPTISASKRQQSHALECAATGISMKTHRGVELQLHLFLKSTPEVRAKLHIPSFSTHRDKVSGNQCGQQQVWWLKRAVITSRFLAQISV
jgi:hypothetical protein